MNEMMHSVKTSPELSVIVPVFNEEQNLAPLLNEILVVLRGRLDFEIVYVDDASNDGTAQMLGQIATCIPELRAFSHTRRSGQSAALWTGVHAARARWVVTLDGDGQNNPADIPTLLQHREAADPAVRLFAGWRTHRQDDAMKRLSSRIANRVRRRLLSDETPDTGCGIKLFERDAFLRLPRFQHMHRYLPALMNRDGWRCQSVPVSHRPRSAGVSKYGVWNRLWVGLADLIGVAWLARRPMAVPAIPLLISRTKGPVERLFDFQPPS